MLKIKRTPVQSSQIAAIGYDSSTQQMDIEFVNRSPDKPASVYRYQNVTPDDLLEFKTADSLGSYFKREIKPFPDRYPYRKLTPEEAAQ